MNTYLFPSLSFVAGMFSKQMPNPAALYYISENWLWTIGMWRGGGYWGASESVRELKLGETDTADTKRTAVENMNEENMDIFLWQLVISCLSRKGQIYIINVYSQEQQSTFYPSLLSSAYHLHYMCTFSNYSLLMFNKSCSDLCNHLYI